MVTGDAITFTPPASAISDSPVRMLWHARCTAASDDEHAVSMAMLGPRRSSSYDSRFARMLRCVPVPVWTVTSAGSTVWSQV
ncbi:hypothetical protein JCM33774_73430 [Actinophytocola sp. KF-1]